MRERTTSLFLLAWLHAFAPLPAPAQISTGAISGTVRDPAGALLSGAPVLVRHLGLGLERHALTDHQGRFLVANLPPGAYSLHANAPGLGNVLTSGVDVAVGASTRVRLSLPAAGRKEELTVQASTSAIDFAARDEGAWLGQTAIERLPLNRRDFLQLALLSAGVVPPVEDSELSTRGAVAMHAAGMREEFNNYLLDGADNNDPYVNRYVVQPPVDTIREFRVTQNGYSAEFGRSAGAQVNVISRSGSNQWHGVLYEYFRNRVLDARNYFETAQSRKLIRNNFGGAAGLPIVKDRLFLFAAGDLFRERRGLPRLATVPSPAARQGDFSSSPTTVIDPFTRAPFPGNRLPAYRIQPAGQAFAHLFPAANRGVAGGNFASQPTEREDAGQMQTRADYSPRGRTQLAFRYSLGRVQLDEPFVEDVDGIPGFGDTVDDQAHQAMLSWTEVFSPALVQNFRAGFNRLDRAILPANQNAPALQTLNLPWLPTGRRDSGFPSINVIGFSRLGDATGLPITRASNTFQLADDLSLVRGSHLWKFGGEVRHLRLHSYLDLLTRGSMTFSGALSGLPMADLLLGFPSFALRAFSDNPQTLRSTSYNLWLNDEWRLTPALHLSAGLRYEYNSPPYDPYGRTSTLDPASGAIVILNSSAPASLRQRPDRNNLAPRLGLAWNLAPAWTLRAGYGLFFDASMLIVNSSQFFNPPQFQMRVYFPSANGLVSLANPFPTTGGMAPPPSLNLLDPALQNTSAHHYSLVLERALPAGVLTAGYVGSSGVHLIRARDTNQPPPAPGPVQARRPDPRFGNIFYVESGANSSYHSLQTTYRLAWRDSFTLQSGYVWSKSIDTASAFLAVKADRNFPQNSSNASLERARSSFDTAHRFTAAALYRIPARHQLLRHFELKSILSWQAGLPFTPILRADNSNTGNTGGNFGSDRPDLLANPALASPTPEAWFDTAAFRVPARYSFGSSGRNVLQGPAYFSLDAGLSREFHLREQARLSLELQAFNLTNHTNFRLPEAYADEPQNFGRVYSARPARQLQIALRFTF